MKSVPLVAEVPLTDRLTSWPAAPPTVKNTKGEASLTAVPLTVRGRLSAVTVMPTTSVSVRPRASVLIMRRASAPE